MWPAAPQQVPLTVWVQDINRQWTHYALHIGQILFLAKHLAGAKWQTLSIPRGKSEEFNEMMKKRLARGG